MKFIFEKNNTLSQQFSLSLQRLILKYILSWNIHNSLIIKTITT